MSAASITKSRDAKFLTHDEQVQSLANWAKRYVNKKPIENNNFCTNECAHDCMQTLLKIDLRFST